MTNTSEMLENIEKQINNFNDNNLLQVRIARDIESHAYGIQIDYVEFYYNFEGIKLDMPIHKVIQKLNINEYEPSVLRPDFIYIPNLSKYFKSNNNDNNLTSDQWESLIGLNFS